MWAYRLDKASVSFGLLQLASVVEKRIDKDAGDMLAKGNIPLNTRMTFRQDIETAKRMARVLGWDGILVGDVQCFTLPGPDSYMLGFIITQATTGQRYVISPVPLTFLAERISWEAHTSADEIRKTRQALTGASPVAPVLRVEEWKRSRRQNLYTHINGASVTVFPAREGGFKGVVASGAINPKTGNEMVAFTHSFPNETECAEYIVANFHEIIKEWGINDRAARNDLFDDWGDDDHDD
jgi:hypothetical protein